MDLYGYGDAYPDFLEFGKFGVHAFFVLSGFFITLTVTRSRDWIEFVYRRTSRIYPAFVIALTITFVFVTFFGPEQFRVSAIDYIASFTMLADNLGARHVDGAYWSLAVELKFYFWMALCFAVLRERFWLGMLGLVAVGAVLTGLSPKIAKEIFIYPYFPFFLAGIALSFQASGESARKFGPIYAVAVASFLHQWNFLQVDGYSQFTVNAVVLSVVMLIIAAVTFKVEFDVAPLTYLGLISYEVYLIHQNIGVTLIGMMRQHLGLSHLVGALVAFAVIVLLAALIHHILQKPVQRVMKTVYGSLRPAQATGARAGAG